MLTSGSSPAPGLSDLCYSGASGQILIYHLPLLQVAGVTRNHWVDYKIHTYGQMEWYDCSSLRLQQAGMCSEN